MRTLRVTSIGLTCAAALTLPLATPAPAAPAGPASAAPTADPPGSTQSLPLAPLGQQSRDRVTGSPVAPGLQGLGRREVRPFSLVGVVWEDVGTELHGAVQVRTRSADTSRWSDWQDLETHNSEHAADAGSAEGLAPGVRGATAPLWVGASDGVEVRVIPEGDAADTPTGTAGLPDGMRLELVDPGPAPDTDAPDDGPRDERAPDAPDTRVAAPGRTAPGTADASAATVLPALTREETEAEAAQETRTGQEGSTEAAGALAAKPYIGPRPRIVTRKGWGADEKLREKNFAYTSTVKAAFVHHSATGNNYTCAQAPSVLRGIYRYHVKSNGWRDIGYNFAVDKCGNIYEGRAGGVTKAVLGAHTLGFNSNSTGIAVLGSYGSTNPPAAAVNGVAKLTAWKLGLFGANPKGKVTLVSGGSNKYKKGKKVKLNVISGHRDGYATECPGARLYKKLGTARTSSARLQGR
ncbi:peptidoglycan recognition protein [uncultured Streptomyces sp.]|uniref:peptidoglycan recognition protein family protein n=1 Tax=uncultured Streptomyces sp. TaxID=174707 RepID=UPI002618119F|nr:peptidoglycan recognition protein [uncultured Streptomyces sp.]